MTHQEFAGVYTSTLNLTRRFLVSRGVVRARAEELAQAAWSKAWEYRDQLRDLNSVAAWVNSIALNLLRTDIRKSAQQITVEERHRPVLSTVEQHLDAEKALKALSEGDRRLMLLHVAAGLTSQEISARVQLSPIAVRVRLHRATVQLRKLFGVLASGPESSVRRPHRRRRITRPMRRHPKGYVTRTLDDDA